MLATNIMSGDGRISRPSGAPLGRILVERAKISEADLERALVIQASVGGLIGAVLIRIGAVSENDVLDGLSLQLDAPVLSQADLDRVRPLIVSTLTLTAIPLDWWVEQEALCWEEKDEVCYTARNPLEPTLLETLGEVFPGRAAVLHLVRGQDLDRELESLRLQSDNDSGDRIDDVQHLREMAEEAPVVEFVNGILSQAVNENASDIHVEPSERQMQVRFRLDGVLQDRAALPRNRFDAIASRIKLVSGMDIAERRLPQDGRIGIRLNGQELDIRVSSVPGMWGESLVMRLLPKERKAFRLDRLGLDGRNGESFQAAIREPHGIILVTGPTGSGKSTTLYAALEAIHDGRNKIITVEDPVEYNIAGVTQIQAHADIGYTFARALRAILRQDPDVIMIGEIRDLETAQIAIQASLTGHMVFSTLHTNDSLSAFTRMIDMGVEPFLVTDSVRGVLAQRLVRRLCDHCAVPVVPPDWAARELKTVQARIGATNLPTPRWHAAVGCPHCQGTGYKGRLGLYEYSPVTPRLREVILRREPLGGLKDILAQEGYWDLRTDGLVKAAAGQTSLEEVLRATGMGAA